MFGGSKVKLDKDLIERSKKHAEEAGYSSLEEFITHAVEKELRSAGGGGTAAEDDEQVTKRLKGLGYIE
jgi:hypothetical protein